jgi:hypothetical protein
MPSEVGVRVFDVIHDILVSRAGRAPDTRSPRRPIKSHF